MIINSYLINNYIKYTILRKIGWSILTYIIFFIKLTIELINNLPNLFLHFTSLEATKLPNMINIYVKINYYE